MVLPWGTLISPWCWDVPFKKDPERLFQKNQFWECVERILLYRSKAHGINHDQKGSLATAKNIIPRDSAGSQKNVLSFKWHPTQIPSHPNPHIFSLRWYIRLREHYWYLNSHELSWQKDQWSCIVNIHLSMIYWSFLSRKVGSTPKTNLYIFWMWRFSIGLSNYTICGIGLFN